MRALLKALKRGWMAFAHTLGKVNTVILLTLFYFVLLAPVGLVVRLCAFLSETPEPQWKTKKPLLATIDTLRHPF